MVNFASSPDGVYHALLPLHGFTLLLFDLVAGSGWDQNAALS
jgi:hypothetical protein